MQTRKLLLLPHPTPTVGSRAALIFGCVLLFWSLCLCGLPAAAAITAPAQAEWNADMPIMQHPAWERLSSQAPYISFAWSKRYLEMKSIAQDTDMYAQQLPLNLENLHSVTVAAQQSVVTLLLDLVPAQSNVQESSYIASLLQQWRWRLEEPLRAIDPMVNSLDHFLTLLDSLSQALEEIPAIIEQRPELEQASQDFIELYKLTHQRTRQLRENIHTVRSAALALFKQMDEAITAAQSRFSAQWVAYYTDPIKISQNSWARLGVDFMTLCTNLTYDSGFPSGVLFSLLMTACTICALWLCHIYMRRLAAQHGKVGFPFFRALCKIFYEQSMGRRLALAYCILVTINTLVDNLPQFHLTVPFIFVQQIIMATGLALWARSAPGTPKVWEMILPIATGIFLLHGDASALLVLLGMGGAVALPLAFILRRGARGDSVLRRVWLTALLASLLLVVLGLGRLVTVLVLLVVIIAASSVMLRLVNSNVALRSHMLARAIFVPIFACILFVVNINLITACSGTEFLLKHWYDNPISILGVQVDYADAIFSLFFLLGLFFLSNIVRQFFESLARRRHILDASAVPVLHTVINCAMWSVFTIFIMHWMGVDISSLAFIGGGFTIGIGIAAKTILGNFFCGLVIIFSRMVRAGDMVEINSVSGRVLSVNMRATVVETYSSGILMVPNEEMLSSRMTNWTLNHRHMRDDLPVSVACQSDVDSVLATMEFAAVGHLGVLSDPPPKAFFVGFGDNSINFLLRVWVNDADDRLSILSAVRQTMCRLFAERGIALASPQIQVTITPQSKTE